MLVPQTSPRRRPRWGCLIALLVALTLLITGVVLALNWRTDQQTSLRAGDTGLRVTALQYLLVDAGNDVSVTGNFATQTTAALRAYQQGNGLRVDGIAHADTLSALGGEPVGTDAPYQRRFRVKAAQTLLGLQGQPVPVQGDFDQATEQAVRALQDARGLTVTGTVDQATWETLMTGPRTGPAVSEADQFFEALAPQARATQAEFGVPAAVSMAQSAQETGYGHSAPGNNYYGIKCFRQVRSPVSFDCADRPTTEWVNGKQVPATESFRSYASMADSARDYGAFLRANSRYAPAFTRTNDPDGFARALQAAGYATDPTYADSLINIMQARNLYQYD
ncbi:flagellum-specific peptidoglycan hydrolase FlgJ [Propionibacteriaceae bacterium ES.041]|nr:hypothetical protein CGZ96_11865 [Enemella evansiae]OYO06189.1 hypothetical protein CGZ97_05975 [Enemella evansiae]OYO11877.1 hypothetical protein CGZ98_06655 [Enemella evansiae]PFG68919.1 flagellum-specific peptidoglycan hydrolase FlgJ [Propionibacteriaceae bacterium ES.041]